MRIAIQSLSQNPDRSNHHHAEDHHRRQPAQARAGSPNRTSSGRRGARAGAELERAKRDATLLWLKEQEDAGIDIVTDGEQSRQHFVHGFLEFVEGIDFEHKVKMGIRNNRYDAMVPVVTGAAAAEGARAPDRGAARCARTPSKQAASSRCPGR